MIGTGMPISQRKMERMRGLLFARSAVTIAEGWRSSPSEGQWRLAEPFDAIG